MEAAELRQRLNVLPEHGRRFRRLLEMLARSGVVEENDRGFPSWLETGHVARDPSQ